MARSQMIKGLPRFLRKPALSKLRGTLKRPAKRGFSKRKILGMNHVYHDGGLLSVSNPKGRLPAVAIVEGYRPGFTVRLDNAPYTVLGYGFRNAERLAVRLALRGHKRAIIRD